MSEFVEGTNVNIASMHVVFGALLPHWKAAGRGTFLLSGGGLADNGKLCSRDFTLSLQFCMVKVLGQWGLALNSAPVQKRTCEALHKGLLQRLHQRA